MATLFIADLHLSAERPGINRQFQAFARDVASGADALYVLGDLFEYWIGDDDLDQPFHREVADALAGITSSGTPLYLMHGNRDLLVGSVFAARCGARIIGDPTMVELHGVPTLLMHGDTLCTDDIEYQKFRAYAQDPGNQAKFLAQPVAARREQMVGLRQQSEAAKHGKTMAIMDVSTAAVDETLRQHGYPRLIHGHTHRPAQHVHHVDGHACERWVLNDWYARGGYLRCDAGGCTAILL